MEALAPLRIRRHLSTEEGPASPVGFGDSGGGPHLRALRGARAMAAGPTKDASDAWGEKEARLRLQLRVRVRCRRAGSPTAAGVGKALRRLL